MIIKNYSLPDVPEDTNSRRTAFYHGILFALMVENTTDFSEIMKLANRYGVSLSDALLYIEAVQDILVSLYIDN